MFVFVLFCRKGAKVPGKVFEYGWFDSQARQFCVGWLDKVRHDLMLVRRKCPFAEGAMVAKTANRPPG